MSGLSLLGREEDSDLRPGEFRIYSRRDFLRRFSKGYANGQHVTLLGPTQRGKTTLAFQMLKEVINTERRTTILAGKPKGRDHTMEAAAKNLNLRRVEEWPPTFHPGDRKKFGFVLQPVQTLKNLQADELNLKKQFRAAMLDAYSSSKPNILFVDEAYHVYQDLGLKREFDAPLMRGAPICAEWSLLQRGRFMTYHVYSAPEHILIFKDPDLSNVKRYAELIGGVNPKLIVELINSLKTYSIGTGQTISEALYIRRSGPEIAIVDVN